MFEVGKSYRFQMRDIVQDADALYEFNAEVVAVDGSLLTLRHQDDGKEEILNIGSMLFVRAEEAS
jgi:hypothetical protein